ncbi:MAG: DUF4350 domain-containing protein [Cyanobacteria bacterium J003]|uniref:DUF4350 domain-containing protein n=1 Tax=Thermosynechococcus sp. M3746_W2019_013 TaxID=2747806 RepID=UPI000F27DDBD|nr:DUF4350 domain-containing protein [Thermosynechococcus sp. M3746_W2019_013]RMH64649.1 MAG: DUF4350 domain-containing protein [Cyanobacteria bacterium J003]HIK22875.1 DUF4350 domain-containing protein [Thermosynechococcus sp. M3746_W2019_013]
MIAIKRRQWFFLGFAVLVLLAIGLLMVAVAPSSRAGSSFDSSPWGTQQFYTYLEQQGLRVERWQHNYSNLKGKGHILIQISGRPIGWPPTLVAWLAQGNTLVRFYWHGEPTAAPFETRLSMPLGTVLIETRRRVPLQQGDRSLLRDDHGLIVYLRRSNTPHNHEQRILGVYPWLVANAYGGETGLANFAVVAQLLQEIAEPRTTLYFDEWLHGYRQRTSEEVLRERVPQTLFDYFSRTPWLAVGLQFALLLLLLLWQQSQRFGPPLLEKEPVTSNSAAYIEALAGVLRRAQQRQFVLEQLQDRFRYDLAQQLGLAASPPHLPQDSELLQAWQSATGRSPDPLQDLLRIRHRVDDAQLLRWLEQAANVLQTLKTTV